MPRLLRRCAPVALALAGCGANTPLTVGPSGSGAALTRIPWGPGEIVDYCGDSLVEGGISTTDGFSVPWRTPLEADADAALGADKPKAVFVHGYSGTAMATWAYSHADVLGHGGTIAFVAWGVNDVTQGVPPKTTAADLERGVLAVWAVEPRKKLVVIGPMNYGELWPEGDNHWDAGIAATSAAMKAATDELAGSGTITFVDPRAWWFPAIQAANPGDMNGASGYTLTVDGLHLNGRGASGAADYIWSLRDPG